MITILDPNITSEKCKIKNTLNTFKLPSPQNISVSKKLIKLLTPNQRHLFIKTNFTTSHAYKSDIAQSQQINTFLRLFAYNKF